jgi:hypothetical protein
VSILFTSLLAYSTVFGRENLADDITFVQIEGQVLAVGLDQPLVLRVIAACVGGFMMFLYSALLILLNRRVLAEPLRPKGYRVAALIWSFLLFGVLSAITLWEQARLLISGG